MRSTATPNDATSVVSAALIFAVGFASPIASAA
jgi:hypothetical protein